MSKRQYDYVIVGGGTAGCVLANRLSADGKYSVLMLEAGPSDNYLWIHLPIGYAKTMFHPVYNWRFKTEADPGMDNRQLYWPRGRTLGGSSSINGLIFIRGQAADYDHWAELGNTEWSWDKVLPYFKKQESNSRGASEYHGDAGPMACTDITERHELIDAIIRGGNELGVPTNDDFNGAQQEGVGYYQLFTRNGMRCSTAVAYLKPARKRVNLHVSVNAHVTALSFADGDARRVTGVQFIQDGVRHQVGAQREVVLAAGSLQSPQLLQLSGIGDPQDLTEHGIAVRHELPGVGKNLQDHLQFRLTYKCSKAITLNDDLASWWRSGKIGLQWLFRRKGPLAIGINQGGLFTNVMPDAERPDIQFHFATLSADKAGAKPHPFSGFTFSVCQLRPKSRGVIKLKSNDPLQAPAMLANYLSTDYDRECAVRSIKFARRLAQTPAMAPYVAAEVNPGSDTQTDDQILDFARAGGETIFHPTGTCKMGDDPLAVVDQRLRVRGVQGLRIVDCSIMPTLVSGNTASPAAMIAEYASDLILHDAHESFTIR